MTKDRLSSKISASLVTRLPASAFVDLVAAQFPVLALDHRAAFHRVLHLALFAQAQSGRQRLAGDPAGQDRARRDFGVQRHRREAAEQAADVGHEVLAGLAAGGIHRHIAVLQVDEGVVARGLHEGARQQFMQQVVLHALALAATWAAAFLLLDLLQLALEQVVDHRCRQDLVLAAHGQPQVFGDAVGELLLFLAAERRDEAARVHFQRANRLEHGVRQQGIDFGKSVAVGKRKNVRLRKNMEFRMAKRKGDRP